MKFLSKLFLLLLIFTSAKAQDFPKPMNPPRLVNDFASFFNSNEQAQLEQLLLTYNDTTSTEISIVTVPSLNDYEINDYGTRLFNQWGIGKKTKNNGVLILITPKSAEGKGQITIITGYGVEGILPDAVCNRIIDTEVLPRFKEGANFEGVKAAVSTIFQLARGSFTPDEYMKKTKGKKSGNFFLIIVFVIVFVIISGLGSKGGGKNLSSRGSSLPFWLLLSLFNSGGSRGSFGDFRSGGGSFGGGGGFGGFGGGSSGGGGASGSW